MTAEPCRKPNTDNQQLLRNKKNPKLKYEVNLRFETRKKIGSRPEKKIGSRPENDKPENEKLNSRFTLIGPLSDTDI